MGEDYNSTFLHFTLNESMEQFSHSRGILPFKVESLFTRKLRPTFLLFDFKTEKVVWGDVNVWFIGSSIPIYTSILFIHILVHSLIAIRVRIWTRDLLSTNLIIKMMNRLLGCSARCFVHFCSTGKYKNDHKQIFFHFSKFCNLDFQKTGKMYCCDTQICTAEFLLFVAIVLQPPPPIPYIQLLFLIFLHGEAITECINKIISSFFQNRRKKISESTKNTSGYNSPFFFMRNKTMHSCSLSTNYIFCTKKFQKYLMLFSCK